MSIQFLLWFIVTAYTADIISVPNYNSLWDFMLLVIPVMDLNSFATIALHHTFYLGCNFPHIFISCGTFIKYFISVDTSTIHRFLFMWYLHLKFYFSSQFNLRFLLWIVIESLMNHFHCGFHLSCFFHHTYHFSYSLDCRFHCSVYLH